MCVLNNWWKWKAVIFIHFQYFLTHLCQVFQRSCLCISQVVFLCFYLSSLYFLMLHLISCRFFFLPLSRCRCRSSRCCCCCQCAPLWLRASLRRSWPSQTRTPSAARRWSATAAPLGPTCAHAARRRKRATARRVLRARSRNCGTTSASVSAAQCAARTR